MNYTPKELRILATLKDMIDTPNGVPMSVLEEKSAAAVGDIQKTLLVLVREGLVQEYVEQDGNGGRTGGYLITRDGLKVIRTHSR